MQLSENYRRGVTERKAWMKAHPGSTWADAVEAYKARRLAENAAHRDLHMVFTETLRTFSRATETAPTAPAPKTEPVPVPVPPEPKLSKLTPDEFRANVDTSFRAQLAHSDGPSSPFWSTWAPESANASQRPRSPFWRGLDSPQGDAA